MSQPRKIPFILLFFLTAFLSYGQTQLNMFEALLNLDEEQVENLVYRYPQWLNEHPAQVFRESRGDQLYSSQGHSFLSFSIYYSLDSMTKLLLDLGADPNLPDAQGNLPLVIMAEMGHAHGLRWLIQAGAQRDARTPQGHSALTMAINKCHFEMMDFLIDQGARLYHDDPELPGLALSIAEYKVGLRQAMVLADHGLESHFVIESAQQGNYEELYRGLLLGMDPNGRDSQGITPLMAAIHAGQFYTTELLLDQGANPNDASLDGLRPLAIAAVQPDLRYFLELKEHGALLDRGETLEETALFYSLIYDNPLALEWLIQRGAELDRRGQEGITPLMVAAYLGDRRAFEMLLAAGADPLLSDYQGNSAVLYALLAYQRNGGVDYYGILQRLIEEGLDSRPYASQARDPRVRALLEDRWR